MGHLRWRATLEWPSQPLCGLITRKMSRIYTFFERFLREVARLDQSHHYHRSKEDDELFRTAVMV